MRPWSSESHALPDAALLPAQFKLMMPFLPAECTLQMLLLVSLCWADEGFLSACRPAKALSYGTIICWI